MKTRCQKCNGRFTESGKRWCLKCSSSMTLEQKIQAQADYKAKQSDIHYKRLHQFDNMEVK